MISLVPATTETLDIAWQFVDSARAFQRAQGFVQWKDDSPNRDTIAADIAAGKGFLLVEDDVPLGYAYLDPDGEPAYDALHTWQVTDTPYLTIHRVAFGEAARGRGLSRTFFSLAKERAHALGLGGIRIDTHADNLRMQHILKREGFVIRGIVRYGDEVRTAYEYVCEPQRDFSLFVDGKNAFPAILDAIGAAEHTLEINMFIWRDDDIGNRIAQAVLAAAERGVKVQISADRYGVVLEKSEECRRSFFHKKQSLIERIKSGFLSLCYPMRGTPRRAKDRITPLYVSLLSHPNVTLDIDRFKADHSKYYIIDDKTLFLGGINIEDKENGADMQGRVYGDYMARIDGRAHVTAFRAKLATGKDCAAGYRFGINRKKIQRFEMESIYLSMIEAAQKELHLTMAYFSALPQFETAILAAAARGVAVTICIPARANYQSDSNLRAVRRLLQKSGCKIRVLLSPKMLHTKLVLTEQAVSFGSTNITKKAFGQLDELNLCFANADTPFCAALRENMANEEALAAPVSDYRTIRYNRFLAWLEGFLV